jgi:hypothetical protein
MINSELIFVVEEAPEGGFSARALGQAIFTDGETMNELKFNIRAAVSCHFEEEKELILVKNFKKSRKIRANL